MFLDEETAKSRLNSESNLINRILGISNSNSEISDSDSDSEIQRNLNLEFPEKSNLVSESKSRVLNKNRSGRLKGIPDFDPMTNEIAGTLAHFDTQKNVARAFGMTQANVGLLENGRERKRDPELNDRIERNLGIVRDKALDRLLSSIDLITEDKLESIGAKDLSTVASNLSRVVEKTLPKREESRVNSQLIVYAPTILNSGEDKYSVIDV